MTFDRAIMDLRKTFNRLDLLTLRSPPQRVALMQRYESLRQSLRKMGYLPEDLDGFQVGGQTLNLVEKIIALGAVYCGFNYDQVFELLREPCNLHPDQLPYLGSQVRRRLNAPDDVIGPAVRVLMASANNNAVDLTPERTLAEIAALAHGDIGQLGEWDHAGNFTFTPSAQLPRHVRALVSEITVTQGRGGEVTTKIKLNDKLKALELLARHLGLTTERVDVNIDISIANRLEQARARVLEGQCERDDSAGGRKLPAPAQTPKGLPALSATTLDRARSRAEQPGSGSDRAGGGDDVPEIAERASD
jgi:hypothetical protein